MTAFQISLRICARASVAMLSAVACQLCINPLLAQRTQPAPQHKNPPALPPNDRTSRPVEPGTLVPINGASGPASSLTSARWTAIGPASLGSGAGLVGGRITGIAVDPTNSSVLYIAAAGGGVWKTTNGGTSWTSLSDTQKTLAMGAIAVAPSNPLKIYAGTGEANNSGDSNHGEGILVSSDGGSTWTMATAGGAFAGVTIGQIAVDPANANIAYAAVGGYPENGDFYTNTGIWKTTDGGTTWTNLTNAQYGSEAGWSAVLVDPNAPTIVYAAIGDLGDSFSNNGVYRSTNSGTTWTELANAPLGSTDTNLGRIALAVAPNAKTSGQHILYVAAADVTTGGLHYFGRSNNADATTPTFTNLTSGTPDFLGAENGGGQGWYDIAVNVDATGVVYCAGVENYANGEQLVIKSSTQGSTWSDISIINGFEPHTDSHAIAFDSSNRMYLGSDGGIFLYSPATPSWASLNSNINTIQFYGIGLHPTNVDAVVGGSQDNGTELYSDNLEWQETDGGDGGSAQFSQTDGSVCYAIHPVASFGTADFFRKSEDGCNTFASFTTGITSGNNANFTPPFLIDPKNGNHLLLGTNTVYETSNGASSWTAIGTPGTHGFDSSGNPVDTVALSDANGKNPQIIYAATGGQFADASQIFLTENNGGAWTEIDLPACTQNSDDSIGCRVNQIVTDPSDLTGHTAVAVTSTFSSSKSSHVFRTTNAGTTWTDITGNLVNLPAWSAQIDTNPDRTIYVAADSGVYSSVTPYGTWKAYGAGLPNAQNLDLELNRGLRLLGTATHGRGAWEILTPAHVTSVSSTAANTAYGVGAVIPIAVHFTAPVTVTGTPTLTLNTSPNVTLSYSSGSGSAALTFVYTVAAGQTTYKNATRGVLDYASTSALSLNGGTIDDDDSVPAEIALYTPGAAGSLSSNRSITITKQPVVSSISPVAGPLAGNTSVTINGYNLTGATAVKFGSASATSFAVNSSTSITVASPAESAGTVDVAVTTPVGTSATSAGDKFQYLPAPTVTSVSPSSGSTAGGTTVTITGTDFVHVTGVSFGTTTATKITVNSATQITATSPAEAAATVDIRVTTLGGTSPITSGDKFTY